ncbi:MAG: protoglobin domain-containing protein [Dehalococcoidia bacterium]
MTTTPHGYTYGDPALAASPVAPHDLEELKASVLWTDADRDALRQAADILIPRTDAILDVWYGFVGGNPHLVATFEGRDGQPDAAYLAAVRARFGLWIRDLCTREFDASWLAYQEEIAVRHHSGMKNRTDGVDSPSDHVPLRHLVALVVPITVTIRGFLADGESDPVRVEAMYQAWFKAVTLSVSLWARPYTPQLW